MDVLIEGDGSQMVFIEGSGSGKKRRKIKVSSVVDWVEDVPADKDSSILPADAVLSDKDYVFCLFNTRRRLDDPALENRDCIAAIEVEGKGACDRRSTLEDFMSAVELHVPYLPYLQQGLSQPLVCSEAFKLLEKDFTEVLKSTCNMKEYAEFVKDVEGVVSAAAARQSWPIAKSEAVLILNTVDVEGMSAARQRKVNDLKAKITAIFWTVLEDGISMLEEGDAYGEVQDSKTDDAISFLRNPENLILTLKEWIASAHLRAQRNSSSHPFSSVATNDVRMAALKYYDIILSSNYSETFRHVGELGRLNFKTITASGAKKAMKSVDNSDAMGALLALNFSEDEKAEEDNSDSSDDGVAIGDYKDSHI